MPNFSITTDGKIFIDNGNGTSTHLGTIDAQGNFVPYGSSAPSLPNDFEAKVRSIVQQELGIVRQELCAFESKILAAIADAQKHPTPARGFFLEKSSPAPKSLPNMENGHEWVDLGLPSGLKWATCNIGASKPEEYGDYFAWGETETKEVYNEASYKLGKWDNDDWRNAFSGSKYVTKSGFGEIDNKSTLEPEDDAAAANWGGKWRMPTADEFEELRKNCKWEWTEQSGVEGYLVKSKTNSASLFLPAAGSRYASGLYYAGSYGFYWSASLFSGYPSSARYLYFGSGNQSTYDSDRAYGFSVRPVCP